MTIIDKILEKLKPYEDKVVVSPLSNEEISIIKSKFKKRIPNYFIEFLQKIGLKQDLIFGINDGVNRFEDLSEFIQSENYFRFGDNGGEDYWLLKFEDENDRTIYEYDYYCDFEIKSLEKTFDELLIESLEDVKSRYEELTPNSAKDWCVQFNVETGSGKFLEKELGKYVEVRLIKELEYVETSPANVKCYEGEIEIEGKRLLLKKQTYKGWNSPSLYFNWQESVEEMKNNSIIKKIDKALSTCVFKHVLTDYGIINREQSKKVGEEK